MLFANHRAQSLKTLGLLLAVSSVFLACAKNTTAKPEEKWEIKDPTYEDFQAVQEITYQPFSETFTQVVYDLNKTSVVFHAADSRGYTVKDLRESDIVLSENGQPVTRFQLEQIPSERLTDVVFVVDSTSGMDKIVGRMKDQANLFQSSADASGIKVNFCLVTFSDKTEKKCDRLGSVNDLKTDLGKMSFKLSYDSNENQLRALIDAVNSTPWRQGARKIIVLVTNAGFSYAPENKGNAGSNAPTYDETYQLLKRSGAMMHVIAPTKIKGYDLNFNDTTSALKNTTEIGRFYDFSKVEKNELKVSDLFADWAQFVPVDYRLQYVVEDQAGLNPELPLARRTLKMSFQDSTWTSGPLYLSSNLPNGRGAYVKRWKLSRIARQVQKNFHILVNGEPYRRFARVDGDFVEMDVAAPAGAEITIFYDLDRFQDQMNTEILVLPTNIDLTRFVVRANGVSLGLDQVRLSQNSNGNYLLNPGLLTADFEDPLNILGHQGLRLEIFGRRRVEQF